MLGILLKEDLILIPELKGSKMTELEMFGALLLILIGVIFQGKRKEMNAGFLMVEKNKRLIISHGLLQEDGD